MMGFTHMLFGLLAGLLFFAPLGHQWYLFIPLAVLGSLLPDVDHENSKINRMFPVTKWVPKLFRHRGFFHSLFPVAIIFFGFRYAGLNYVGLPLAVGYLSHLLSDSLTKAGLNLLHPLSTIRIQGFVETGGVAEFVVLGVVVCLNALVLVRLLF